MTTFFPLSWTLEDRKGYYCGIARLMPQEGKPALELSSYFWTLKTDPEPVSAEVLVMNSWRAEPADLPVTVEKKEFEGSDLAWYYFTLQVDPGSDITISIIAGGKDVARGDCKSSVDLNSPAVVEQSTGTVPRLYFALNTTKVNPPANLTGEFTVDALRELLEYLWRRLCEGPEAAWLGPDGIESVIRLNSNDQDVAMEEKWARLVSQLLVLSPYSAPSNAYNLFGRPLNQGGGGPDSLILAKAQDAEDPGYPVILACQQLCSIGAITRGYRYPYTATRRNDGLPETCNFIEAGRNGARNGVRTLSGSDNWITDPPSGAASLLGDPHNLGPCSIFSRKNDTHVAFLLRVKADKKEFQFLDTGAMATLPTPLQTEGNGDYGWAKAIACDEGFEAGLLDRKVTQADLDHMRKARPLGFARLLILRGETVLFSTPLLPMHWTGEFDNFPYSTYFWSLRQVPYQQAVRVLWLFYNPMHAMARALISTSRNTSLEEMWNGITPRPDLNTEIVPLLYLRNVGDKAEVLCRRRLGYQWGTATDGGLFRLVERLHTTRQLLPDRFTGTLVSQHGFEAALEGLDYFRGRWRNPVPPRQ